MSETITSIEEHTEGERWDSWEGYKITTDAQEILLVITNEQICCEHWGYMTSEDDTSKFVGAELLGVELTDENLTSYEYGGDSYEGDAVFVNILTSRGKLQFVLYNDHNGYYGHTVKIESNQLNHSTSV